MPDEKKGLIGEYNNTNTASYAIYRQAVNQSIAFELEVILLINYTLKKILQDNKKYEDNSYN